MIDKLRRKMIWISWLSFLAVFLIALVVLVVVSVTRISRMADELTSILSAHNGRFPMTEMHEFPKETDPPQESAYWNEETPASTRYFSVWLDENENVTDVDIDSISTISKTQAMEYATRAQKGRSDRGWIGSYRYRVTQTESGSLVIFVDSSMMQSMTRSLLLSVCGIFLGISVIVLGLIFLLSKKAVKPAAESYEKQKQFVTDANHELKTPLTLILTDVEIAESELGKNEWIDDIRSAGERMSVLVNQLVLLSRMDEHCEKAQGTQFCISDAVAETVTLFQPCAARKQLQFYDTIEPGLECRGDETKVRQLVSILTENAVKYCDAGGTISIHFWKRHKFHFTIQNTFAQVQDLDLKKVFDRFYRADPSRTETDGFGIGLSIAQELVRSQKGSISASRVGDDQILFSFQIA